MPWYENISFFSPQHQEIASFKKKPSHAIMQPIRRKLENNDILDDDLTIIGIGK